MTQPQQQALIDNVKRAGEARPDSLVPAEDAEMLQQYVKKLLRHLAASLLKKEWPVIEMVMQDACRRSVFIFGLRTGRKEFKQSLYFIACLSCY